MQWSPDAKKNFKQRKQNFQFDCDHSAIKYQVIAKGKNGTEACVSTRHFLPIVKLYLQLKPPFKL